MATRASKIRELTTRIARENGINPAAAIGLIEELTQYGEGARGGRLGVFGVPEALVDADKRDAFLKDMPAQVGLGISILKGLKNEEDTTDLGALSLYLGGDLEGGDPAAAHRAVKAFARGARQTGEKIGDTELRAAYSALGVGMGDAPPEKSPVVWNDEADKENVKTELTTSEKSKAKDGLIQKAFTDEPDGLDAQDLPEAIKGHLKTVLE